MSMPRSMIWPRALFLPLALLLLALGLLMLCPIAPDSGVGVGVESGVRVGKPTPASTLIAQLGSLPVEAAVPLAKRRLAELTTLAASDPVRALALILNPDELAALPPDVRRHCERPFDGVGAIDLLWRTDFQADGKLACTHAQTFTVDGKTHLLVGPAFTSPQRPMRDVPLQGWLLADDVFLASPFISGDADDPPQPVEASHFPSEQIKVLFVRVDFSDIPGEPVTRADLASALGTVSNHLSNYSYGLAGLTAVVTSQLYRMPSTGASYATSGNNTLLMQHARNAAAAHHTLAEFDVVGVYFPNLSNIPGSQITYGGLASVGGSNHWINGVSAFGRVSVILHEFGHNYGLFHANYWYPPGARDGTLTGSFLDPGGNSLEYGDPFDRMGVGSATNGHFSPPALQSIGWLPSGKIVHPTASGVHRIHRFDSPAALGSPTLALRLPGADGTAYWVSHRHLFPLTAGRALVVNQGFYPGRPNLIDATPGSQASAFDDRGDAALPVGQSFTAANSGFTLTTLAAGGTEPAQWVDVQVQFQPRIELAQSELSIEESAGNALVTVRRLFDYSQPASVSYSTIPGSAGAPADFLATSGTITWAAGDSAERVIRIPIRPDMLREAPESFTLALSDPVNAILSPGAASTTITILNPGNRHPRFQPPFMSASVNGIVPLADGSLVIAGNLNNGITGHIARLFADGTEDTGFLKTTGFNGSVDTLVSLPDGSMLAAGSFTRYNGSHAPGMARLLPTGALDTEFSTNLGTAANGQILALARETSGNLLVGGDFTSFAGADCPGIVRLNPDGTRNTLQPVSPGFLTDFTPTIRGIHAEPDGKITVTGTFIYPFQSGFGYRSGVARLLANGARDTSFEPGFGLHGTSGYNQIRNGHSLIRLDDGRYLVGGSFSAFNGDPVSNLVCLTANGARDPLFSPPAIGETITHLLQQANSRIIVGGSFSSPAGRLVALLSGSGAADPAWQALGGAEGSVRHLANAHDGSLLVGGNFFSFGGQSSRPVVRLASGLTAYDAWRRDSFSAAQIAAGQTGANDDFDGDGATNLTEMIVGTNPTVAGKSGLPGPLDLGILSGRRLAATFPMPANAAGLWAGAQFSDDLATWQPANPFGSHSFYVIPPSPVGQLRIEESGSFPDRPRRFIRAVYQLPE
jgi:uncharacterized delta-60 repeat protein